VHIKFVAISLFKGFIFAKVAFFYKENNLMLEKMNSMEIFSY